MSRPTSHTVLALVIGPPTVAGLHRIAVRTQKMSRLVLQNPTAFFPGNPHLQRMWNPPRDRQKDRRRIGWWNVSFVMHPQTTWPSARCPSPEVPLCSQKQREASSEGRQDTHSDHCQHRELSAEDDNEDIDGVFFHVPSEDEWALNVLTFPEKLLIALVYPQLYVFKLFPKRRQGVRNVSMLQRAMRDNVCSYEPNIDAIASMVQGKLMPRPPAILASLIMITFIAVRQIPKNWLQAPTNAEGIPSFVLTVPLGDDISSDDPHASAQEGGQ